jgi:hypothetical protein
VIASPAFLPRAKEAGMLALTELVILAALRDFEAIQGASVKFSAMCRCWRSSSCRSCAAA